MGHDLQKEIWRHIRKPGNLQRLVCSCLVCQRKPVNNWVLCSFCLLESINSFWTVWQSWLLNTKSFALNNQLYTLRLCVLMCKISVYWLIKKKQIKIIIQQTLTSTSIITKRGEFGSRVVCLHLTSCTWSRKPRVFISNIWCPVV